ncbi:MAG: hypothetical protein ABW167_13265 [Baekduia sp.]
MPAFVLSAAAAARVVYASSADDDTVVVRNTGANPAEVSKEGTLVAGQGVPIAAGGTERFDVQMGEQLYALSVAGSTIIVE